jgi:hypothetical protein
MPLELHSNDTAREARPGLWIFQGKCVVLIPLGVAAFILIFKALASLDVDWYLTLPLATLPMLGFTLFVWLFVNGKPSSYASDLWLLKLWRFKCWLYLHGYLDRPPLLWVERKAPQHPKQF